MAHALFDHPVFLKLQDGEAYEARGPRDAAEYLERHWPAERAAHYRRARILCHAASDALIEPETARVALIDAALRAGILLDARDLEVMAEPVGDDLPSVDWGSRSRSLARDLEVVDSDLAGYNQASDILDDPYLSPSRKRGLLAFWASDVHAVPGSPALRRVRHVTVTIDSILDAMCALDAGIDQGAMIAAGETAGRAWQE